MTDVGSDYLSMMTGSPPSTQPDPTVDVKEVIQLAAADSEFFSRHFFPKAFRQESPLYASELWDAMESSNRLVNIEVFRGGSKTTRFRSFLAKSISYGALHTALIIGKSESHSVRTIRWIKNQMMYNSRWTQTFSLRPGNKWTDVEIEIFHGIDEFPISIIGMGITGSIRGINQDDWRPELIALDDIHDEENSATVEQRTKIDELVFGAIMESLAPESEAPHAKLMNLFTPLNKEDVGSKALLDKAFYSIQIPCWTKETWHFPTHLQKSAWPARWSDEVLRTQKDQAAARNKLSTFLREKELKLVSPETSDFRAEWLDRWQILPEGMVTYLAIDPVPPPTKQAVAKGLHKRDFESLAAVGLWKGKYYVLEISCNRGHDPSWTCAEFFRLALKYRPRRIFVEAVAYQATLAWLLREEMKRKAIYFAIEEIIDNRSKRDKIVDALNGVASNGMLAVPHDAELRGEGMKMFLEQWAQYPNVNHEDALESVAIAVTGATGKYDTQDGSLETLLEEENRSYPRLAYSRGAP